MAFLCSQKSDGRDAEATNLHLRVPFWLFYCFVMIEHFSLFMTDRHIVLVGSNEASGDSAAFSLLTAMSNY